MKKLLSVLLTVIMLAAIVSGCNTSGGANTGTTEAQPSSTATEPGTFPIVEEKISLRIMVPVTADHSTSLNDLEMFKEYEELTNIHVEWEEVSDTAYDEKYKLVLATNDLPDAFGSAFTYDSGVIFKYGQEGMIVPLEDIIDEASVNIKGFLEERDDLRKAITFPDGHIYALPGLDENLNIQVDAIWQVNQTYLDILGLDHPTTLEEIHDYLLLATSQDLNGDGRNETGISYQNISDGNHPNYLTYMLGYFGVAWDVKTYMNQTIDGKGPLVFAPAMEETRQGLEYFHEWYKEGLFDEEIFTQNSQQLKAKAKTEGVAMSIAFWYLELNDGDEDENEYRAVVMPQNEDGTAVWRRQYLIPGLSANQFFITNANEYPYETIRYLDYWMDSHQNALTVRFGPEGYSWEWLDDEKTIWTETATVPSGEPRTMANSTLECPWGHGIPYFVMRDFWGQKERTAFTSIERMGCINEENSYIANATQGIPELIYSTEDNEESLEIKTDLFSYVNTQLAKFLTEGITDESWNTYLETLDAYNVERYVELFNKYYDLYMN